MPDSRTGQRRAETLPGSKGGEVGRQWSGGTTAGAAATGQRHDGKALERRRVTIREIAEEAGASKSAVSLVLNGQPGVGEELRRRILEITEQLGWRPNAHARALSSARAYTVGLVVAREPEVLAEDPFFPRFLAGVETALSARGYSLSLAVVTGGRGAEREAYRRMAQARAADGVLLIDLQPEDTRFELVRQLSLPAVAVGTPVGPCPLPWLAPDETDVLVEAMQLIATAGHKRVAHVGGDTRFVHSHRRRSLWKAACSVAGLRAGPSVPGDFNARGGYLATRKLLSRVPPPTAIFYSNDLMAIGGLNAASEMGVRVPSELSVIGFDDVPLAAHLTPALTTVNQYVTDWGKAATHALLTLIEGGEWETPTMRKPDLMVRSSTGPAPRSTRA